MIFDGNGNFNLFNIKAANYNYFEGLTIRNTDIGDLGGHAVHRRLERADRQTLPLRERQHWASSRTTQAPATSISPTAFSWAATIRSTSSDGTGPSGRSSTASTDRVFPPKLDSYTAVRLYGPGHVVAYNYIADFHDGIDIETYGNPDGSHAIDGPHYPPKEFWDRRPVAIDFYNNYMTNFHDNAFEIDGSMHNVRVMRNMMLNSASHPFCNQPAIGGPVYWIRNIAYHAPGGSTRHDERFGGRAVLQQHDPDGDRRPVRRPTCIGGTI